MYIRAKTIPRKSKSGVTYHTYYYLVEGVRQGNRVKQKVIKYLGKHAPAGYGYRSPNFGAPGTNSPTPRLGTTGKAEFTPILNTKGKESRHFVLAWAQRLGVEKFIFKSGRLPYQGRYDPEVKTLIYTKQADDYTFTHELGHHIDCHVLNFISRSKLFTDSSLKQELQNLTEYRLTFSNGGARNLIENLKRYYEAVPSKKSALQIDQYLNAIHDKIDDYYYNPQEQFADLFAVCVLEPRKANALAPRAFHLMTELFQNHPQLSQFLSALATPRRALDKT